MRRFEKFINKMVNMLTMRNIDFLTNSIFSPSLPDT
jgi:hypothetical protein